MRTFSAFQFLRIVWLFRLIQLLLEQKAMFGKYVRSCFTCLVVTAIVVVVILAMIIFRSGIIAAVTALF